MTLLMGLKMKSVSNEIWSFLLEGNLEHVDMASMDAKVFSKVWNLVDGEIFYQMTDNISWSLEESLE